MPSTARLLALAWLLGACSSDSEGAADDPGGLTDDVLCGARPGGSAYGSQVLRFETVDRDTVVQIARRDAGASAGESRRFELEGFALVRDGKTECVSAGEALAYENTHHNWGDRARATIAGVDYELGMTYALPTASSSGVWEIELSAKRGDDVVTPPTQLVRTGGPLSCFACPAPLPVYVSELVPNNRSTLADDAGEYAPWLELFNTSSDPVSLKGWTLSNDLDDRGLWALPDITIPRNDFVIVFADGDTEEGPLHAGFSLSSEGGELILTRGDGVTDGGMAYGASEQDRSYIVDLETGEYTTTDEATPGALNPNVPE